MEEKEKVPGKIKNKFKIWLKNPYNLLFIAIILLALGLRLYYFSLTINQPLWWDESEYMLKAKSIAFGTPDTGWFPLRPILFPLISAVFFKIGLGEISLRVLMLLFSVIGLVLFYYLGKILFNEKVALISTFLFSFLYLDFFYTMRLLVDVPQIFFVLLGALLFVWSEYHKKSKKLIWAILPVLFLGVLFRFTVGLFIVVLLIFLLFLKGFNLIKEKDWYISSGIGLLIFLPYLIYSKIVYGGFFSTFAGVAGSQRSALDTPFNVFITYLKYFPNYIGIILLIVFLFGLLFIFYSLSLRYDQLRKNQESQKYIFLLLWIIIPLVYFGFFVNHFEDRYIYMLLPAVFLIIGVSLNFLFEKIKKYSKILAILLIGAILLFSGYQMFVQSNSIVKDKVTSYEDLRNVGLWIKQNSLPSEAIISAAVPELTYYSEHATYGHKDNLTAELSIIREKNVKYYVVTSWERAPDWVYTYVSQQNQTTFYPVYESTGNYRGQTTFAVVFKVN